MHTANIFLSPALIAKMVRCIEDAVGDDIRADIRQHDLQTKNSVPSRIWDLLNTNIIKTLDTEDCTIAKAHRGPWEMLVVYEKSTHCIFTFMRESALLNFVIASIREDVCIISICLQDSLMQIC
mgnify:CR=1 FL=1